MAQRSHDPISMLSGFALSTTLSHSPEKLDYDHFITTVLTVQNIDREVKMEEAERKLLQSGHEAVTCPSGRERSTHIWLQEAVVGLLQRSIVAESAAGIND